MAAKACLALALVAMLVPQATALFGFGGDEEVDPAADAQRNISAFGKLNCDLQVQCIACRQGARPQLHALGCRCSPRGTASAAPADPITQRAAAAALFLRNGPALTAAGMESQTVNFGDSGEVRGGLCVGAYVRVKYRGRRCSWCRYGARPPRGAAHRPPSDPLAPAPPLRLQVTMYEPASRELVLVFKDSGLSGERHPQSRAVSQLYNRQSPKRHCFSAHMERSHRASCLMNVCRCSLMQTSGQRSFQP